MKKLNIFTTALLLSVFIFSCKKDGIHEITTTKADDAAQIKLYNFSINSPSLNFYANDAKLSAISSVTGIEATTGIAYGSIFPSSNYSFLTGGAYTFKGITPALATADPNLTVATFQTTLVNGKFYSLYTCGFYNTTAKTSDVFIIEDKIPEANATSANVRFVNTVPNATAAFDLVVKNTTTLTETVVARNIAYKGVSDFALVPNGVYEVYARYANGTTNVITRNGTSVVSFIYGRTYTVSSRGDMTVTSTTAANRPFLDNTSNRP